MGRGFFDGSAEGYEKGRADGLAGRPKVPVGSLPELAAHAVRPKSYTETFVKAYSRGHADGNRQKNAPPPPVQSFYQERFFKEQYFKAKREGKVRRPDRPPPDAADRER